MHLPVLLGLVFGLCGLAGHAQDEAVPTLHIYANLVQVPVLVLSPSRERTKPVDGGRFFVSIDSGPQFRATHVRREGEDPISMAVVLDLSGASTKLMPRFEAAFAALAPMSLRPQDHVTIYALDCSLVRSGVEISAEPRGLEQALHGVLSRWEERRRSGAVACVQGVHLWDALVFATDALSKAPGRRVVLAVTQGRDLGSKNGWNQLRFFAQGKGVAVFGMSYPPDAADRNARSRQSSENAFNSLCELSGGLVLFASEDNVRERLLQLTQMLRERYIVEFPPPSNGTAGEHVLLVSIKRSNLFIRPSGVSMALPDPGVLADPSTIRSDPSLAPVVGSRRVLSAPR
ncbi:MAG: hypothetical protein NVSMB3_13410 [Acidobacteriaceae bacterium]